MPASAPPATMTSASPRRMISDDSPSAWPPDGAGRDGREVRPGHPERDGDLARADVRDPHRDQERADAARAAQGVGGDALDERPDAAEPGREDDPGPLRQLALEPLPAARPGRAPRARPRARTGCSGPSGGCPSCRGCATRRSRGPRPAICDVSRDGSNASIVRTPDRPATRPAQVVATSLPRAVTAPIPVTTTRRRSSRAVRAHRTSFPGADRGGAVDVAGEAAGRDRVRDRERVELGALDLRLDVAVDQVDQRPRRRRVAVEDVARRSRR